MNNQINFDDAYNSFKKELFLYRKNSKEATNTIIRANEYKYPYGKEVRMTLEERINCLSSFFINYGYSAIELIIKNLTDFKCISLSENELEQINTFFKSTFLNEVLHLRNITLTAQYQGFPPSDLSDWHFMQGFDRKAEEIFTRLDIALKKFNANATPPVPGKVSILNPNNKYFNLVMFLAGIAGIIGLIVTIILLI